MILTAEMDPSAVQRLSSREIAVVFLDIGRVGPHTSNIRTDYERVFAKPLSIFSNLATGSYVFCALRELGRAGLQVRKDVSLVGCDDISLAKLTGPQPTTIMIPRAEIGSAAVQAVLQTNSREGREIKISTQPIIRRSTDRALLLLKQACGLRFHRRL